MKNLSLGALLKSKTVWASVLGSVAWALSQPHLDAPTIVQAASAVLGAIGVRDAIGGR